VEAGSWRLDHDQHVDHHDDAGAADHLDHPQAVDAHVAIR